ncbi:valine--tRNA ligase [Candidatus Gracilibacteria bacterium]|nr:valine--tRNA ligase [Candidatus Gracilibacteria bacterium]
MKLPKAYSAKKYENGIYSAWEKAKAFMPKMVKGKKPFTIMMPPPNATGTLHLGHATMLALQDIMIRYHRMKGDPTLWLPGTDHASIATQNKVEKIIAGEGLTRHSMGRKPFLKRVEKFVKGSQSTIRNQVRKMGSSCDWSRERYTLDPQLSEAVREIFVRMYNDGLIYRGNRIVNWCPRCTSTLADDEVTYKEQKTKFYYLKYGPFTIGTARPETKFLDKVIVVHPDDERYKQWIGKEVMVPWIDGQVKAKIIADKSADPKFGSGAMTITPAHDFIDFEIAQRNKLEIVQIIDEKGNLTAHAGQFAGRNAREAREDLIKKMEEKGLVERIDENYTHNLSICYRCGTAIEPLVSRQWFISVDRPFGKKKKTLKQMALEVVRKKEVTIVPERFEKTYFQWMENLHDWCISRQIWFGHEIPVWYCDSGCKEPIVEVKAPKKCPHCGGKKLHQDPDTLDTWFSSGLWTFSTLGWPKKTKDLEYFHPTSVLETGYDILFFWVARMILMTTYALDTVPFKHVYLHGLVRTRDGAKMSKSHPETCIDPLDMIEKYGADALRLSMVIGGAPGNDVRLYEEKIAGFRNFVNKIWNATRFALLQTENKKLPKKLIVKPKTAADKWILTRLQLLVKETTDDIEAFRFSEAGTKIYDFTWNEYCAWYLEFSKGDQQNISVLMHVLETLLKLLHPFVPYVTEVIWKELGKGGKNDFIMNAPWPKVDKKFIFKKEADAMNAVVASITAVRTLRQENNIDVTKKIGATFVSTKWKKVLHEQRESIMRMARLSEFNIAATKSVQGPVLSQFTNDIEVVLPLSELVDLDKERARLLAEKDQLQNYINGLDTKLKNPNFTGRAPAHIIQADTERLAAAKEKYSKIGEQLEQMR